MQIGNNRNVLHIKRLQEGGDRFHVGRKGTTAHAIAIVPYLLRQYRHDIGWYGPLQHKGAVEFLDETGHERVTGEDVRCPSPLGAGKSSHPATEELC